MLALCQEYLDPVKVTIHHGITTLLLVPADLSGTVGVLVTTTASLAEKNATSNASHPNFLVKLLFIFYDYGIFDDLYFLDKCEKPQDAGGCQGNFSRWSYDKSSMTCQEFTWGGCQGNENNFLSERECHLRCKDSARSRGKTISGSFEYKKKELTTLITSGLYIKYQSGITVKKVVSLLISLFNPLLHTNKTNQKHTCTQSKCPLLSVAT